jgi:hypothetical protein
MNLDWPQVLIAALVVFLFLRFAPAPAGCGCQQRKQKLQNLGGRLFGAS